jgi:hypothetical protein
MDTRKSTGFVAEKIVENYNCFLEESFLYLLKEKAGSRKPEVRSKKYLKTSDFRLRTMIKHITNY